MATEKVVIDPITRIEGHLRIELEREGDQIKPRGVRLLSSAVSKPL